MLSIYVTAGNRDKYFFEKLAENIKNNEFPVSFLTAFIVIYEIIKSCFRGNLKKRYCYGYLRSKNSHIIILRKVFVIYVKYKL